MFQLRLDLLRRLPPVIFAIAAMWALPDGCAHAQQGRLGVGFQMNMSRFIPPPRAINQQLKDAEEAIEEERYSDAIVILGDLLERNVDPARDASIAGQDFFLDISDSDQQRLDRSFLRRCRTMIGSLPVAAMETYELRYGALAERTLKEATGSRNWNALREVRRKYFHTQAGYKASLLLAQREMYLGHPLAASLLLDEMVNTKPAVAQLGEGLLVLHAVACRLSGRSLPRSLSTTEVSLQLSDAGAKETITDWRQWIDQHYTRSALSKVSGNRDYLLLGGDVARNDSDDGQLPLSTPRWMLETTATPLEEQELRRKEDELAASGRLVPPSWTPIRIGNQLLMRTTERLRGVDYRTGKRVWQYPWFQPDEEEKTQQTLMFRGRSPGRDADRLTRRVWNDLPYGQITSDGKRVFLLDDLSPYQTLQINPLMGIRNANPANGGRNTLIALELETEGKTLWRLGQDPTVESELNEAFFLGAPIAVDGALYAMVEWSSDIVLVCLDPATGKLRWQQQLVAIEGAGIQFDAIRRIGGATPSYHEGVLICPTGAGATVAVDLVDRTLRWGNSYQRRATGGAMTFRSSQMNESSEQLLQRWHNSAAVASGTAVLVTPVSTDNCFCFELVDGKKRFTKTRQATFYLAGVRDDQLVLAGAREVVAYKMENGRLNWRTDQRLLSAGQQIVGRGVFGPDSYIVPTSSNELVKISLEDGQLIERRTTRYPLGNLIAVDGEIISQGATRLVVALGEKTLGPRVERMLKEDPNNLDALIQKALLLSEQGQRVEALEVLQKARQIDPDSDDVLMLSITSMLGELRENASPPEGLEMELDQLIDTPSQRLEFLALRIESAIRGGAVREATERLLEFSSVMAKTPPLGNEDDSILRDPGRDCNLDAWLSARAADITELAEQQDEQQVVESLVRVYLEKEAQSSTKTLKSLARQLHPFEIDDLLITLAGRSMEEGDLLEAERRLLGPLRPARVLNQGERPFSDERIAALAKVYLSGDLPEDAALLLDESLKVDGVNLDQLRVQAEAELQARQVKLNLDGPVKLTWQSQAMIGGGPSGLVQRLVQPTLQAGNAFQGWSVINQAGATGLRDSYGDPLALPMNEVGLSRTSDRKASISGGVMVLERPGRISVVNLFAVNASRRMDALLWNRDFGADGALNTTRRMDTSAFGDSDFSYPTNTGAANLISEFRVGPVLGDRVLVLKAGDLLAVSLTNNGETIWRNSSAEPTGHLLVDERKVAQVTFRKGIVAKVSLFDLLDGRKLGSSDWEHGKVWATSGKHVLAYQEDASASSAKVRLVDPFSGEVKLETDALVKQPLKRTAGRGMGRVLQGRFMVLYDTTGRLVVWDLLKGTELCSHETGEIPELQSMYAMWVSGQILVFPAKAVARTKGDMLTQQGEVHRTLHRAIAISVQTGEINWRRDFEQPWGVTIDQPYGAQVLLLARSLTTYKIRGSERKLDVAMIRLSDGETIHEQLGQLVAAKTTGLTTLVTAQPALNRLRARIDRELLLYEFDSKAPEVTQPDDE